MALLSQKLKRGKTISGMKGWHHRHKSEKLGKGISEKKDGIPLTKAERQAKPSQKVKQSHHQHSHESKNSKKNTKMNMKTNMQLNVRMKMNVKKRKRTRMKI
jgi:hypothetical protein